MSHQSKHGCMKSYWSHRCANFISLLCTLFAALSAPQTNIDLTDICNNGKTPTAAFHHVFQSAAFQFAPKADNQKNGEDSGQNWTLLRPPTPPLPFLISLCHYTPMLASQLISVLLNVKLRRGLRKRRFSFLSFNLPSQFANGIDIDFVGRQPRREWWSATLSPPPPSSNDQQLPAMTYFQLCVEDKRLKTWLEDYYGAKGLIHQGFWTTYAGWEHQPCGIYVISLFFKAWSCHYSVKLWAYLVYANLINLILASIWNYSLRIQTESHLHVLHLLRVFCNI